MYNILPEHFNHLDDSNFIIRMLYKTLTNPVLLTLWTRFLSYHFYRSIVESLNSLELIASPSSWLVAFWQQW